jgi:hypothetical protein
MKPRISAVSSTALKTVPGHETVDNPIKLGLTAGRRGVNSFIELPPRTQMLAHLRPRSGECSPSIEAATRFLSRERVARLTSNYQEKFRWVEARQGVACG